MEIWQQIKNFPDYAVSNLGRVKSFKYDKEKILKPAINSTGYLIVIIKGDKRKTFKVHQLVAIAFLDHTPDKYTVVVDHINSVKTDNRLENLRLVTNRFNLYKDKKGSSKYTGVYWHKKSLKWHSQIEFNGKRKHLGLFDNEYESNLAYQKAVNQL